jgi:glycosyltransferase involved in cell wall biosynthesis
METKTLTATVLMAVYNDEKFLEQALQSILNQLTEDMELLIIDDCSSDRSSDILQALISRDARVRLIRNSTNQGLGYCLALGTKIAIGKYIIRMDSDDISLPGRFGKQIQFLEQHPDIDILGGGAIEIDEHCQIGVLRQMPCDHEKIKSLIWANPLIHPTVAFRKEKILLAGNYQHQDSRRSEDYELWFRCVKTGLRFANLAEPLVYYRFSSESPKKKRLKQAIHQAKVGWIGCRMLSLSWWKYLAVIWPIFISLFPPSISYFVYRMISPFDPRKSYR